MTINDDAFEEQTCGKGLAVNSVLPAKLAELTTGLADILHHHMKALDSDEENGRTELEAYESLVRKYRGISEALTKAADEMKSYRDLPVAEHDMSVMTSQRAVDLFETFIRIKRELLHMLKNGVEQDERMLTQMRS